MTVQRSGISDFRIFTIGTNVTVAISGLTIANGSRDLRGGGIFKDSGGNLTVSNSALVGNSALAVSGDSLGGGIYSAAPFSVTDSSFSGNTASYGGGTYNAGAALVVKNS